MSNNKMLIDATHPEETRVVVLHGGRVEEFDYESAARKLLRGNIYLAKITRVEPSLQAAFVEYGGNRHGFLAFNEIHPDYYQIPMADRRALLDEEAAAEAEEEAYVDAQAEARAQRGAEPSDDAGEPPEELTPAEPAPAESEDKAESVEPASAPSAIAAEAAPLDEILADPLVETFGGSETLRVSSEAEAGAQALDASPAAGASDAGGGLREVDGNGGEPESVEQVGTEDALEELPSRPRRPAQLQDPGGHQAPPGHPGASREGGARQQGRGAHDLPVARRPLHRADAEHRARGGISRKITNPQDRKRPRPSPPTSRCPRAWASSSAPGAARTSRRSSATSSISCACGKACATSPCRARRRASSEEGNLIKRSIRDLYNRTSRRSSSPGRTPTARPRTSCACSCRAMPRT